MLKIEEGRAVVPKEFLDGKTRQLATLSPMLEGAKRWRGGDYTFEATQNNLDAYTTVFGGPRIKAAPSFEAYAEEQKPKKMRGMFAFKTEPWGGEEGHQNRAFKKARRKKAFAFFMEVGTGKTKVAIDLSSDEFQAGEIDIVMVWAPKGVHSQWTDPSEDEPSPLEVHCSVPFVAHSWPWKEKDRPKLIKGKLLVVSFNYDSLITEQGFSEMERIMKMGRVFIIADESQRLKNPGAKRSKQAAILAPLAVKRLILTGTPLAKSLVDVWAQFKWLDPNIVGDKYLTTFRSKYCIMGGWEGRQVVGHKNVDQFLKIIDPYVFRATQDELNLPASVYAPYQFELSGIQRKHYDALRKDFITKFEDGTEVTVANAATMLLRLQQIACGYLAHEGRIEEIEDARFPALQSILEQREGKMVIWCRFTRDIERICDAYGGVAVPYYGGNVNERDDAKRRFLHTPGVRYFVGNPQAGGTGLDGLQKVSKTVIYYSNSFSSLDRWQSEGRNRRIGMGDESCTYIDLIARKTIDQRLISVLRKKKTLSDQVMDVTTSMTIEELRSMIAA